MKHTIQATIIIILMFIAAQLIGALVIYSYDYNFGKTRINIVQEAQKQNITLPEPNISFIKETVSPPIEAKEPIDILKIVITILIAILIGSFLFLLLLKIGVVKVIKGWFAIVIFTCLGIAITLLLYPILGQQLFSIANVKFSLAEAIALPSAIILTFFKIFKRNLIVHNITELFIYPGLAVVFLPMLNVISASILLIAISIYDVVAVWRSNYMVNLAKFQVEHLKLFSGFFVPYLTKKDKILLKEARAIAKKTKSKSKINKKIKKIKVQIAALGGGDVAFPLIFLGTILLTYGLGAFFIILGCILSSLIALLIYSKKGKFYPAMPFLTAGCFLGLFIVLLTF